VRCFAIRGHCPQVDLTLAARAPTVAFADPAVEDPDGQLAQQPVDGLHCSELFDEMRLLSEGAL
jgi:hypothetical protein